LRRIRKSDADASEHKSRDRGRCSDHAPPESLHWVEPKLVAEITYLTWTADGLLRHTVYVGLREDKPAGDVRRETPVEGGG
jgi:bifunctional non-homologous end joining protein LigD